MWKKVQYGHLYELDFDDPLRPLFLLIDDFASLRVLNVIFEHIMSEP
jgi:hypothetical protein